MHVSETACRSATLLGKIVSTPENRVGSMFLPLRRHRPPAPHREAGREHEFVVLRGEPHLLPMRLQVRVLEDARDAGVAQREALTAQMLAKKMRRPLRHRDADVRWRTTRLGDYPCGVGVGERARGRPDRGASASFVAGSSALRNRSRHSNTVRTWTPTSFAVSYVLTPCATVPAASSGDQVADALPKVQNR